MPGVKFARCPQTVSGMILYYACVPNIDKVTGSNVTFIEMLTNRHTAYNIKIFLQTFKNEYF